MCFIFIFLYYTFYFVWLSFFLANTSLHSFPLSQSSKNHSHYYLLCVVSTHCASGQGDIFFFFFFVHFHGALVVGVLKASLCEWHIYSNCNDRFQRKRKDKRKKAFLGQSRNFLLVGHPSFFSNKLVFLHQQWKQNQNQPFNSSKTT